MRMQLRIFVALVPLVIVSLALAGPGNRPPSKRGPEPAVGAPSAEERAARQVQLFEWLTAERPAGVLDRPVRVPISDEERGNLSSPSWRNRPGEPQRIGLVKPMEPALDLSGLSDGPGRFRTTPDGGFVWSATISSPGADAIRVRLQDFSLPGDADLYFYSPGGEVRGPYQRRGPEGTGDFWTNSLNGDTGILAVRHFGPASVDDRRNVSMVITEVGHIGRTTPRPDPRDHNANHTWTNNQCGNASCVVDASCGNLGPAGPAADAIAKYEWIQGAWIYTCTGGLIADTDGSSQRNLFLSANHCLNKSRANMETFFNYTTSSCEGDCPPDAPSPDTTGMTVLATGRGGDFTLMELSQNPPAGAVFLPFNNSPVAFNDGEDLYRISNPNYGPQVFSHHQVDASTGTCTGLPRGESIYSVDIVGATDGGSSGSPVVNGASEIVGQLYGCCGFNCADVCDSGSNATVDGALAFYYDSVAQYLDPMGGGGCSSNAECDDGQFCNGQETCSGGSCQAGSSPCAAGETCDEGGDQCLSCSLGQPGASCSADADCCSNKCKGPPSNKTCR